jgi:hypothetical protein
LTKRLKEKKLITAGSNKPGHYWKACMKGWKPFNTMAFAGSIKCLKAIKPCLTSTYDKLQYLVNAYTLALITGN